MGRKQRRRRRKRLVLKSPSIEVPTYAPVQSANGMAVFAPELAKMTEIRDRSFSILERSRSNIYEHPEVRIARSIFHGLRVSFIYEDGPVLVMSTTADWKFEYVNTELLDECVEFLRREQVLESLSELR
ncbi:MAG: hypothetical protein AB7L09_01510 [Nitrospira sp.]